MVTEEPQLTRADRRHLQKALVDELCRLACVRDPTQRGLFAESVGEELERPVNLPGRDVRSDAVHLVRLSLAERHGVEVLFYAIALHAGDDVAGPLRDRVLAARPPRQLLREVFTPAEETAARALLADQVVAPRALRDRLARELRLELPHGLTAVELWEHLVEANAQADGLPPAVVLLECTALLAPRGAERLRAWSEAWADRSGPAVREALSARRERLSRPASPDRDIPRCLVVMVDPAHDGSGEVYVRHWVNSTAGYWEPLPGDPEVTTLGSLSGAVERAVRHGESLWLDSAAEDRGPVYIEFVLPYELLNHDVAQLQLGAHTFDPVTIGPRYSVHLRSLERLRAQEPGQLRRWRRRWRALRAASVAQPHRWEGESATALPRWRSTLVADEQLTAVTLDAPALPGRGLEPLQAAISEGIGLALWDRRDRPQPQAREVMNILIGFSPAQIPAQVRRLRAQAESDAAGPHFLGPHIAFFWDDPFRLIDCEEVSA